MITLTQPLELCKVSYDRSAKQYVVRNGREVARFPSGPENKQKALWAAVAHDGGEIYDAAQEILAEYAGIDGLERRLLKAARMLQRGHLDTIKADAGLIFATVKSESIDGQTYKLNNNLAWSCDCEDHENGQALRFGHNRRSGGAPFISGLGCCCKHVLMLVIMQRVASIRRRAFDQAAQRREADRIERRSTAGAIGDDIKRMLGQTTGNATPATPTYTTEQVDGAYKRAIGPERGRHRPFGAAGRMNKLDF